MNIPNDNHTVAFFDFIEKHDIQVPVIKGTMCRDGR